MRKIEGILYVARAAEFRELARTATGPILTSAYARIAANCEARANTVAQGNS
jgi:hypothetical protein